jgi:hypothetical protein
LDGVSDGQCARFEKWEAQRKVLGKSVCDLYEEFFQCFDRLLMILLGETSLDAVLPFR